MCADPLSRVFWKSSSFFCLLNPHLILQPEVMGIHLHGAGILGSMVWPRAEITCSQGTPHVNVGSPVLPPPFCTTPHLCASPPTSVSLPFLPGWMNVASLNLWYSDQLSFHRAQFSDSSGCDLFWGLAVILSVVMWGCEVCLPKPPPWAEVSPFLYTLWLLPFVSWS